MQQAADIEAIRHSADSRFRAVFELACGGIVVLNPNLDCIDGNPAFCDILCVSRTELIGRNLASFVAIDDNPCSEINSSLRASGRWNGTLRMLRGTGGTARVEWQIVAESADGTRIAMVTDVTERRRAEDERDRLNRAKDEFLVTVSHDLRNPLSVILGWVSVLQRLPGTPPEMLKGLQAIERSSRLQSHLIADLLNYPGMR
jgi:PAS domain S-box-containing protein